MQVTTEQNNEWNLNSIVVFIDEETGRFLLITYLAIYGTDGKAKSLVTCSQETSA